MPVALLTVVKLVLLALLYAFLIRAYRAVSVDLFGARPRNAAPPPRPATSPPQPRRGGKPPRELVVHPPHGRPQVLTLDREAVTLGRSEKVTVAIDDVYMSEEHALIAPDGKGWVLRDLGSTNGTYLNGAKVTRPTVITAGDQLRVGKTRVEVRR